MYSQHYKLLWGKLRTGYEIETCLYFIKRYAPFILQRSEFGIAIFSHYTGNWVLHIRKNSTLKRWSDIATGQEWSHHSSMCPKDVPW